MPLSVASPDWVGKVLCPGPMCGRVSSSCSNSVTINVLTLNKHLDIVRY